MTIEVHGPDGSVVQFPDGTSSDVITSVMGKHFGAPAQSPASGPSFEEGLARSFSEGVPIVGGLLNRADAATNAAMAPLLNRFFPKDQQLPEATFADRYKHSLADQEHLDKQFSADHPVASTLADVAGAVASTGGVAGTETGAKLLGLAGKTLPEMVRNGAISAGAIGATDAAVRGQDPLVGGTIGAAAGAAGPLLGRAVGTLAAPIARTIRGLRDPEAEAARRVATSLSRDIGAGNAGLTPQEFATARNSGVPVSLIDAGGETTRALARSAANTSPEGRSILNQAIDQRFATQGDRLTEWLNTTFNYPNAPATQKALEEVARTVNRPAYARAYSEGSNGIWDDRFEQMSQAPVVQDAIRRTMVSAKNEAARNGFTPPQNPFTFDKSGRLVLKEDARGNRTLPNLQFWDNVKRNLDRVGTPQSKEWSRVLRDELDSEYPSYAPARAGAAKFFGAEDALEAGQQAVSSKMKNREMAAGLAKMSPAERKLFQDGFVDRYVQAIREVPDRRSVLNQIANSTASRERLNLALGTEKAKALEAFLRIEGVMDTARSAVQGNSTTARQLAELGLAGGLNLYEGHGHFTADPVALTHALLLFGAARGSRAIDERVAQQVARLLTSNDIGQISKGIKLLARNGTLMRAIRNADAAIGALTTRGAAPAIGRSLNGPTGSYPQ